ncbi:FAD-dependent oxidoreductase [Entomomonas sp. E2T0]|uniref:FAD-dependent oxidoreductase n=1 Tax=Entomomonas sp. E2T0 TaxID=2930213 RepID=UPI0022281DA9|nr:FAD-dependent oxidoreductase [Entomomonas sp. E2T0]UYZ83927.1 FAD-dependent oxidoreductase [Entomomonas sp. E2T0]
MNAWDNLNNNDEYDIVVIGAGGAGMSAAVFATMKGAKVLLVERTEYVGGTTAFSAGTTWIPNTHHAASVGAFNDTKDKAKHYLNIVIGEKADQAMLDAFLDAGPIAVEEIEQNSSVRYRARPFHPDYQSEEQDSTLCGRALEPLPFDGRLLGQRFKLVRPPIPEFTVLGGMMIDRDDITQLLNLTKNIKSFCYSTKLLARHVMDKLRYPRGTRLVMGNALIASLLYSLDKRQVPILLETEMTQLLTDEQGISGVELTHQGNTKKIKVKGGVILASGGFNRNIERRKHLAPTIDINWCPGAPGHTAQAHVVAEKLGAVYGDINGPTNCFWAPVSTRKRADNSIAVFPHFILDRGKPGMITLNQRGERFVNESTSYHRFGLAQQTTNSIPSYLITDTEGLRKYGLGMVRPGGKKLQPFLADGYLIQGNTIAELARKLGIDPAKTAQSIAQMNEYAKTGNDLQFARGTTDYQRANGDAFNKPNPNLGTITQPPFYAVRLYPGDIGACTGFATNTNAQVLNANKQVINKLYAVGNDMQSIMGGTYPGPGITLGPGLAFAWIAANHAVQSSAKNS